MRIISDEIKCPIINEGMLHGIIIGSVELSKVYIKLIRELPGEKSWQLNVKVINSKAYSKWKANFRIISCRCGRFIIRK